MRQRELAVEVHDLSVRFGDFFAVDHITFDVPKGEIFGFLGANGAGKTTTIRVLCGLLLPTSGHVRVAGKGFEHGEDEIKARVGYMSQRFTLYDDLTVAENLAFTASLRKIPVEVLQKRQRELFDFIGFDRDVSTTVKDLPGGIKQQVSLAAAILHDPDIVFLDEPTAGVTPAARARFWSLIRKLAAGGKTVFVTTHYMDEAEQCERIALMRSGRIIALDSPAGLKASAFPEPVYELDPIPGAGEAWVEEIRKSSALKSLQVYGMRYHAVVADADAWRKLLTLCDRLFKVRRIQPSLEDVFIRLVEGGAS